VSAARRLAGVFAHPDDESRIVGGALARAAAAGVEVSLYCATRGEAGDPGRSPQNTAALRGTELRAACATLGITTLWLDDFPDGGLDVVDGGLLDERIVRFLRTVRPQTVVTFGPDGRTGHPDHIVIGQRAEAAFHAAGDPGCWPRHAEDGLAAWQPAWLYHTAVARSVAERVGWSVAALPDEELIAVDVSSVLDRKRRAAVEAHASQWRCRRSTCPAAGAHGRWSTTAWW
jgi:N-acetylglucosamine malate deacetylase 2